MNKSFVSVGVIVLDVVGSHINSIPNSEESSIIEKIHHCTAGTAAAPAAIAARNGITTTLVGAIGNDDVGHFLKGKMEREGIDTDCVQMRTDLPTATSMHAINDRGERPYWHMPGAFLMLELTEDMRSRIVSADHIHWGGVGLLFNLDGEQAVGVLAEAKENGAIITADLIHPGPHTLNSVKAIAPYLDYFMPSIDEALAISGADNVAAAAEFFMNLGAKGCVIKCGGDGAYIATRDGIREQIPVVRDVEVVDTGGCGDAFCGGFNVALAKDFDPVKACHFAAATAAQVASGVGSDAGVKNFETSLRIMEAGSMKILEEQA